MAVEPDVDVGVAQVDVGVVVGRLGGLAAFKVPTYVDLWQDKLPRNASGKLLKNVLRGEGEVSFAETM